MDIFISEAITRKLRERHNVEEHEVFECFQNRRGKFALDDRSAHQTSPPTLWFIGETNKRRLLKVIFIRHGKSEAVIKSVYPPNPDEIRLFEKFKQQG